MSTKKGYEFDIKKNLGTWPSSVFMHLDFFFLIRNKLFVFLKKLK